MSKATDFRVKMSMPYEFKKAYAETRINEFMREYGKLFDYIGFDYHYPYTPGAKAWTK